MKIRYPQPTAVKTLSPAEATQKAAMTARQTRIYGDQQGEAGI